MMFGPQTGGSTLPVLRCNEASPSTVELGQRLKGSQRAKRVRSTPTIGRNVATQRFSALGHELPRNVVGITAVYLG